MRPIITVDQVSRRFGSGTLALADCSLSVAPGAFVTLLGPSGCGKSTVLRMIAGLDHPSDGTIRVLADTDRERESSISFVFQEPTLMPWATVFDNVWLPRRLAGVSRDAARSDIEAVLTRVGLESFAGAYPRQLSGGMKMRVSIARALVSRPRVLLMDEPFAALDEISREQLNDDLADWCRALSLTTVFVTHSVFEAVYLSDRILVMSPRPGRVSADIGISPSIPRDQAFRGSAQYAALCAQVSQSLRAAAGDSGRPTR